MQDELFSIEPTTYTVRELKCVYWTLIGHPDWGPPPTLVDERRAAQRLLEEEVRLYSVDGWERAEPRHRVSESRPRIREDAWGPPPWFFGFSKQFKKDTSGLDRNVMGKILEILEQVADYAPPFTPHGDTFKPLTGDLAGCWRYRLGQSRLVLQPIPERCQINVLTFGARGSVYD